MSSRLEEPGFASGIFVPEHPTLRKINGREQAASFAGNGSKKRIANSASTSKSQPVEGAKTDETKLESPMKPQDAGNRRAL